jgi:hypothetical protein
MVRIPWCLKVVEDLYIKKCSKYGYKCGIEEEE